MAKTSKKREKVVVVIKETKPIPFWLVFFIFLITTFIFFYDQILMNSFFWEDFVEYVFPVQFYAAKAFSQGQIPFWNPYTFAGMPFLADIQVGFFYVFNRLLSLFTLTGGNLPVLALELIIILHFLIAQLNMYVLARFFKISSYGALISSISYSFSMFLVVHIIHPMIVYHLAWLPLILYLFLRSFDEDKFYFSILSGLVLGMALLSGHPQTTLYVLTLLGITGIFQLFFYIKGKLKLSQILKAVLLFFMPFVIAFGIFSIQYFPSRELSKYAQRNEVSYEKATEGALQFKQIYTAIVPKLFGWVEGSKLENASFYLRFKGELQTHFFWETVYYFGITSAILGFFAALVGYRSRYVWLMIILVVFGFLFSLGSGSPLFDLFFNLPYFGIFRNPGRMMFFVVLGMSLLGGLGFDFLWKNALKRDTLIKLLIPSSIAFILAIFASSGFFAEVFNAPIVAYDIIKDSGSFSLVVILIVLTVGVLLNRAVLPPAVAGVILAILCFVDLYYVGAGFNRNPNNPEKTYELKPELKAMLMPKPPNEIFRVSSRLYEPIRFMAMQRNQGLIDGIMLIDGYNPLILERVLPPLNTTSQVNDLYNVRYEVKVDLEKGTWGFFERTSYFPRAWFVDNYVVVSEKEIQDFMRKTPIDYKKTVVLEKQPSFVKNNQDTANQNSVACLHYTENYFKFRVKTTSSAILVFSEIWYPEWKAYVDGMPFEIYRANYCFRAIEVPKGEHIVEMKFISDSFILGAYISIFTILLSMIGLIVFYRIEIGKHINIIAKKN